MATHRSRIRGSILRVLGLIITPTAGALDSASPSILSGSGLPTAAEPDGSIHLRTDGAPSFRSSSTWSELGAPRKTEWELFDDLFGRADTEADQLWVLNSGGDAEALDPAIDTAQAGGVWQLVTGDADGTVANDGSGMVWGDVPIQLDSAGGDVVVEARVRIKSAITLCSLGFGLTDSTALEEPFTGATDTITSVATDAVGFLYDDGNTTKEWFACAVDTDTDDTGIAATGTAPTADTWQILKIVVSNDGATCKFYIDDTLVTTLSGDAGVGPDVVLYPYLIACSTTTTSRTVDVDWVRVSGVR